MVKMVDILFGKSLIRTQSVGEQQVIIECMYDFNINHHLGVHGLFPSVLPPLPNCFRFHVRCSLTR